MWRSLSGFKAQYHDLILLTVPEFDEWKTLVHSPSVTIHGNRQFSEAKAKAHAIEIAHKYLTEVRHEPADSPEVQWLPTDHDDWLIWRA
jgi:hypothetical protein